MLEYLREDIFMRKLFLLSVTLFVCSSAFSLEVDRSELQSVSQTAIEFINYTGPHRVIDSAAAIRSIGSGMGAVISGSRGSSSRAGNARYSVIHAVDPSEKGRLDADILIIGADAEVDHINNLRRIIAGYLETAYGYSRDDSDTLAVFITVYNAVYRGKLDEAGKKYKQIVLDNVTSADFGLSVNYRDWPGHSQIIIPVYDAENGGLSTVDTSVISDSKVVESMKDDDDRNVESRKNMVDIKERESEDASEAAKAAQKDAVAEQKTADEEQKKADDAQQRADDAQKAADSAQKEADDAQKKADEAKQAAAENPRDSQAQKDAKQAQAEADEAAKRADDAQKEADDAQKEADDAQKKADDAQQRADDAKEDAQEKQALADKKQAEAQAERKEIARDQQAIQEIEAAQANMKVDYGIVLFDDKSVLSRMVRYNSQTGEVVKNSPVTTLRGRSIYKAGDGYIAIAGENSKNGAIKLVLISPDNMEISMESELNIAADSVLVQDGGEYYCVIDDGGEYYVGKFGADLSLKLKSQVKVKAATPIAIGSSTISVTDSRGTFKVLDKSDLSDIAGGK